MARGQVIDYDDFVFSLGQLLGQVGADESGAARDDNFAHST
jgi:hypothetical protein